MRRKVFNCTAAMSLLLCAATMTLWPLSRGKFFQVAGLLHGVYWRGEADQWGLHTERVVGFDPGHTVQTFSHGLFANSRPCFFMVTSPPMVSLHQCPGAMFADGQTDVEYREDGVPVSLGEAILPARSVSFQSRGPFAFTALHVHYPDALVLFGLLPSIWTVLYFLRRRRRAGDCFTCGYNLTGNTSGVCPECGTPVPQPANSPTLAGKGSEGHEAMEELT